MKTLIIKFLPSAAYSKTQNLLTAFENAIASKSEVEVLDLIQSPAPAFTEASMAAYYKRNYQKQSLNETEALLLSKQDELIAQLKSADVVVLAQPLHNFGLPGPVKQWLDAVMFNDDTFVYGAKAMAGRKALVLYTSGGRYNAELVNAQYPNWDTLTQAVKINFGFMGFDDCQVISASLSDPNQFDQNLTKVTQEINALVHQWYQA
jgi:FMN-dependent NADH-azoreductase